MSGFILYIFIYIVWYSSIQIYQIYRYNRESTNWEISSVEDFKVTIFMRHMTNIRNRAGVFIFLFPNYSYCEIAKQIIKLILFTIWLIPECFGHSKNFSIWWNRNIYSKCVRVKFCKYAAISDVLQHMNKTMSLTLYITQISIWSKNKITCCFSHLFSLFVISNRFEKLEETCARLRECIMYI